LQGRAVIKTLEELGNVDFAAQLRPTTLTGLGPFRAEGFGHRSHTHVALKASTVGRHSLEPRLLPCRHQVLSTAGVSNMQPSVPEVLRIGDDRSDEDMPLYLLELEGLWK